jgi:hypothetical protein
LEVGGRWSQLSSEPKVQVKTRVAPALAAAFKAICREKCVTLSGGLAQLMKGAEKGLKPVLPDVSTRRQRRKEVDALISRLERVRDEEEAYKDRIPVNLQGAEAYEAAEQSIQLMEMIIEQMFEIYL